MQVLYDSTTFVRQQYGGISRYFSEIISRIAAMDDVQVALHLGLYVNRYGLEKLRHRYARFSGMRRPNLRKTHRIAQWVSRKHFLRFARRASFDLYHTTEFFEADLQTDRPKVITVHDMTHFHRRWPSPGFDREKTAAAIRSADGIICVSEHTRRDLIRLLDIPEDRTATIHHGAPPKLTPSPSRAIAEPYILWVGARSPYKNILSLIEAHARVASLRNGYRLVLFGGSKLREDERQLLEKLGTLDRVKVIPAGDDRTLANVYANASAFVHPSNYEGFGIPVFEAFTYGCPVVSSTGGSLPEIGGDAAIYFDPTNPDDLAEKLLRVIGDETLRGKLIAAGTERLKCFSWDRCAQETVSFYRKLVASR